MEIDKKSLRQCIYCHNFCKFSCAPYLETKNQKIIQTQKNYLIYLIEQKKIEPTNGLGEAVYLCNDCRRCEAYCIFDSKKVIENNRFAKNLIFQRKLAPKKVYDIYDNLEKFGNITGTTHVRNKPDGADKKVKYDFLVYPGDYVNLLSNSISISFAKILEKLGKSFIFFDDDISDGVLALDFGMEEIAIELFKKNLQSIKEYSFDTLVVLNPYSYYFFKYEYEKYGFKLDFNIIHYFDFLEKNIADLEIKKTNDNIKYFDPCMLSRGLEISESPRNILKAVCINQDFDLMKNRKESECCGGNLSFIFPEVSQRIAAGFLERLKIQNEQVDTIITGCPLCLSNLLKANRGNGLKIFEMAEYISETMI